MRPLLVVAAGVAAALSVLSVVSLASGASAACPAGAVEALIGGNRGCLGEERKCVTRFDLEYSRYGFACTAERLTRRAPWTTTVLPEGTVARAINDHGQIVGRFDVVGPAGYSHAFLWQSGVMRDLGTLGGLVSEATAINERGQAPRILVSGLSNTLRPGG